LFALSFHLVTFISCQQALPTRTAGGELKRSLVYPEFGVREGARRDR